MRSISMLVTLGLLMLSLPCMAAFTEENITNDMVNNSAQDMAVDGSGNCYFLYTKSFDLWGNTYHDLYYQKRLSGGTWHLAKKVNSGLILESSPFHASIDVDSSGNPHIAYVKTPSGGHVEDSDLITVFGYWSGGTFYFSSEETHTCFTAHNYSHTRWPCIRVSPDDDDLITLAWDQHPNSSNTDHDIYFEFSTDGGDNWSSDCDPISTVDTDYLNWLCKMEMDSDSNTYVVWENTE